MKIKYALCGMLAMLPVICCAQAMTEQQKNFHEKVINPIKREISPLVHLCWFENLESSSVCVNGTSGMGYEIPHYIKNKDIESVKVQSNDYTAKALSKGKVLVSTVTVTATKKYDNATYVMKAYLDGNDFVWSDSKDSTCIEKSLCVDGITDTIGVGMEHTFKFE